jgi:hypothetical protein
MSYSYFIFNFWELYITISNFNNLYNWMDELKFQQCVIFLSSIFENYSSLFQILIIYTFEWMSWNLSNVSYFIFNFENYSSLFQISINTYTFKWMSYVSYFIFNFRELFITISNFKLIHIHLNGWAETWTMCHILFSIFENYSSLFSNFNNLYIWMDELKLEQCVIFFIFNFWELFITIFKF